MNEDKTKSSSTSTKKTTSKKIKTLAMVDGLGTTVGQLNPTKILSEEEQMLFMFDNPGLFPDSIRQRLFNKYMTKTGLTKVAQDVKKQVDALNVPESKKIYVFYDIMASKYCERIGDPNQLVRTVVAEKIYYLIDPDFFPKLSEYAKEKYGEKIEMLMLTQGNQTTKPVFEKKLVESGADVDLLVAPDKEKLKGLYKHNPQLYSEIAAIYNLPTQDMGLIDDSAKNIAAAKDAGVTTQQYSGSVDKKELDKAGKDLIDKMFSSQPNTPNL